MFVSLVTAVCLVLPSGATVTDPFRAPPCDRCAGNRGLDLAVVAGQPVTAGLDGTVWFAGKVAGRNYVVVRAARDQRVRVTYGGLASIDVESGQRVARGTPLGVSTDALFVGVRIGDRYVDPMTLASRGGAHAPPQSGEPGATHSDRAVIPRFRITLGTAHGASPVNRC
ncbi:MAG: peptidoglycan DD-metalloendopeptidase family protein [Actinomycetota bacterium]